MVLSTFNFQLSFCLCRLDLHSFTISNYEMYKIPMSNIFVHLRESYGLKLHVLLYNFFGVFDTIIVFYVASQQLHPLCIILKSYVVMSILMSFNLHQEANRSRKRLHLQESHAIPAVDMIPLLMKIRSAKKFG